MGCSAIHPGGERLPELLDEGPEEPNPARLAQARAEPGRGANYSSTVGGKVRPEEGPVAEEEAQGGRGGEDCATLRATTRSRRTEAPPHGESGRGEGAAG